MNHYNIDQLIEAIEVGEFEIARRIVETEPALVSARESMGDQPLHYACWHKRPEVVRFLLERGADIHARGDNGRTPLHYAAYEGEGGASEEIGRMLLDAGADPNARDVLDRTPLDYAVIEQHEPLEALIRLLTERGAKTTATSALMRQSPASFARVLEERRADTPDGMLEVLEAVAQAADRPEHLRVVRQEIERRRR